MTDYVIGPIYGDWLTFQAVLEKIDFNAEQDRLWFSGDVVGHDEGSLNLLRYIKDLGKCAILVLGRQEMQLMAAAEGFYTDTDFSAVLNASDADEIVRWLSLRPFLHHENGMTLIHAGLPAEWSLSQARTFAIEAEASLSMGNRKTFFENVIGDTPTRWHAKLRGWKRTRFIVNAFTRMTYCDETGRFDFSLSPWQTELDPSYQPWYLQANRALAGQRLICAYQLQTEGEIPAEIYALQKSEESEFINVLFLTEKAEIHSFPRLGGQDKMLRVSAQN